MPAEGIVLETLPATPTEAAQGTVDICDLAAEIYTRQRRGLRFGHADIPLPQTVKCLSTEAEAFAYVVEGDDVSNVYVTPQDSESITIGEVSMIGTYHTVCHKAAYTGSYQYMCHGPLEIDVYSATDALDPSLVREFACHGPEGAEDLDSGNYQCHVLETGTVFGPKTS